jgi:hypothetical protein
MTDSTQGLMVVVLIKMNAVHVPLPAPPKALRFVISKLFLNAES